MPGSHVINCRVQVSEEIGVGVCGFIGLILVVTHSWELRGFVFLCESPLVIATED